MQGLKVENVKRSSLVPSARNPRKNDAAAKRLAVAIQAHGWTNPILAQRSSRRVLAGHTRLKAAGILGMADVPVIFLDVDDRQADAIMIADNRLGELAEWDEALLADILAGMQDDGVDLAAVGFDDDDLAEILSPLSDDMGAMGKKDAAKRPPMAQLMLTIEEHASVEAAIVAAMAGTARTRGEALGQIAEAFLGRR